MWAVEFETYAKNGMIEIPEEYRNMAEGQLKIILLKQDQKTRPSTIERNSNIKNLLKRIQEKNIFQSIDNPAEWQRTIRDEWS